MHAAGTVVVLSLVTAAGWGFMPVMVELAERSTGGASTTMMVLGEFFGVVLLAPFVLARRTPLFVAAPQAGDRRRVVALLVGAGVLNALLLGPVLRADRPDRPGAHDAHLAPPHRSSPSSGSIVFLRERLGARLALGAAVTLAGVFLATLAHAH